MPFDPKWRRLCPAIPSYDELMTSHYTLIPMLFKLVRLPLAGLICQQTTRIRSLKYNLVFYTHFTGSIIAIRYAKLR